MINDTFYKRRYVLTAIITVVILVYLARLFSMQLLDDKYKDAADSNAFFHKTVYPPRGLIYDRNGELLVFNSPSYDIMVIQREMATNHFDTLDFCEHLHIDREEFNKRMEDMRSRRGYSRRTPQIFMSQLNSKDIADVREVIHKYPGVSIQNRTLRGYSYPYACHVLGSVGEVSQRDLERDSYYSLGDYSGRDGIEYSYEADLRGEKGVEVMLRDARGRIKGSYENGMYDKAATAGKDITLTLDINLQIVAERLLNGKIGSAVAIEPHSGEILALASNPGWDPSLLVGRQRSSNYSALSKDVNKPLMNRATQATYPPGSTFKTVQALVCLERGGITPHSCFACSGPGSKPIKCTHHHGSPVDLLNAIEQSCNPYFWQAFKNTLERDGYGSGNVDFVRNYKLWRDDVMSFGLGAKFDDSDLYSQRSGSIPTEKFYEHYYGKTGWRALTIRSLSIGQGEILTTPLQMANMMAAIANEGYYITPHLNKSDSMLLRRHETSVSPEHFSVVKEGMCRVFEYGTGRWHKIEGVEMGGKTGTAQNPHGDDHSLFIGFAPKDNPQIVVAVVVENAGFGATWAAPIASLMIEQYLFGEIKRSQVYDRMCNTSTNSNVTKRP